MKKLFSRLTLTMTVVALCTVLSYAQYTVTGTVTDENGDALIGVNIFVEGTTVGTVTDLDGSYALDVANSPATLVFSYLGYASQDVIVSSDSNVIDLAMTESSSTLDEVVITGLATTVKRKNLANSVARVNAKDLTGVTPQATLDGALYGKFKGAEIRANSGAPGGGISFKLRGVDFYQWFFTTSYYC